MDWSLIQRRNYSDTFDGGDYERDMAEAPGLRALFPGVDDRAFLTVEAEEFYQTEHQKRLYRQLLGDDSSC